MSKVIKEQIKVIGHDITIKNINGVEYISLTDLARYSNPNDPSTVIKFWMSNKNSFEYYCLWEELNNDNFNSVQLHRIKSDIGMNRFIMTPTKWGKECNAIGIIASAGKYSDGTFAHPDIALEFASWISPSFKLHLIKEFQRLKQNEDYQNKVEWNLRRLLSKTNYIVHTDAVKFHLIVPKLTKQQITYVYATEADLLNVALFGMTAKEFKINNKDLKGNLRDYASIPQLIILSNIENVNAALISKGISPEERIVTLNNIVNKQIDLFKDNENINKIEKLIDSNN